MPARIPDNIRAAILTDIRTGHKTRYRIARDHHVAPSTVAVIAKRAGLVNPFARAQTQKATEALGLSNAARRASLATRLLHLSEQALTQAETSLDEASALQAATVAGIAVDKHLGLVRHDADPGVDTARNMLGALAAGLGVAYDQLQQPAPAEDP